MSLRTLSAVVLALTLPAAAHAEPSVSLGINDGDFVDASTALLGGWVSGVDTTHVVSVNGLVIPFAPSVDSDLDGVADSGPITLTVAAAGPGVSQDMSAMHSIRAEVLEPDVFGTKLVAAAQVAFYDTSELGGHAEAQDNWHRDSVMFRISDDGLDDVAEVAAQTLIAAHAQELVPRVEALFPPGPAVDEALPLQKCDSLGALGMSTSDLVLASAFGMSDADFNLLPVGLIKLCAVGITADIDVDVDGLLTDRPDVDLDGVMDPLVALDSRSGWVEGTLTLGPVTASGEVTVYVELSIEAALLANPLLLASVGRATLALHCGAEVGTEWSRAVAQLDLNGTGTPEIDVDHLGFEVDLELDSSFDGLCAPLGVFAEVLEQPIENVLESALECALNDPACGVPMVDDAVEQALADVGFEAEVPIGETATLDVAATITWIEEDPNGVTVTFDSQALRGELDPFFDLVPVQPEAYATWATGGSFTTTTPYDLALYAEAAQLDQVLHAAFRAGVFHRELTVAGDLAELGLPVGGDPTRPLDGDLLDNFFDGLGADASTPLVVRIGPKLAPIVVVEDTASPQYTMRASMFGVEIVVLDAVSGDEWFRAVSDLKADVTLAIGPAGEVTAQLTNDTFTADVVGAGGIALWKRTFDGGLRGALQVWVTQQLATQILAVPLPTLTVPTGLDPEPVLEFTATDAITQHSGQEVYALVDLAP